MALWGVPAPVITPAKTPTISPLVPLDPGEHVRELCPEQTRRFMDPWIIAPDSDPLGC